MSKPLYIFDMDETLINADCASLWNQFLVDQGIVQDPDFMRQDQHLMQLYAQGDMAMEEYLAFAMSPLAGIPCQQVANWVDQCVEHYILPRQFPQAKQLVNSLLAQQQELLVISASVSFLVHAVAARLGIEQALGIDLQVVDGCYTEQITGIPSYREGKVARLRQWLAEQNNRFDELHFYTDSINDLPLCLHADYAYLVNPCPQLAKYANQPGWQQLHWG
ncbi:HAD family hydrolase [Vibrio sp.]|uniref:HAD family hydrolase n=1 Tax=Vibrio sp. TaxID=678 RepID=UPI003D0A4B30